MAWAAASAEPSTVFTESELLAVLDDAHPAVQERMARLAVARSRIEAAEKLENPVLGILREDPSGPDVETQWSLSWQLPDRNRRRMISARQESAAAESARLALQLQEVRLAMREAYADWAVAAARFRRLEDQAKRVAELAERERLRAERGEASGLEARRLELAASVLRSRVALARGATARTRAEVAAWHPTLPPHAVPDLPEVPSSTTPAANHPLVRAAENDLAAATLEGETARRFLGTPQVSLGWIRIEGENESADGPIVGVSWSLPIADRNQAEQTASEARISAARARLTSVRRQVDADRSGALAAFESLKSALLAARSDLAPSERMLDGKEAAFRHGEATLTDLLETYRSVTESELAILDLYDAALAASRDLERANGVALPASPPDTPTPTQNTPLETLP